MTPILRRFSFQAMGSYCEIQLFDKSRIEAKKKVRAMAGEVSRLEKKYSRFRNDSLVAAINASAGDKLGIKLDTETRALFDHALSCYEESQGLFDITAGILNRIWDFKRASVPDQKSINKLLPLIGFHKLHLSKSRLTMPEDMEVDFGGIVKEYAADCAANMGRSMGIEHGLVNLGGDFAVIGAQPDNLPWTIGIANPNERSAMMAKIDLLQGGLASSGDYERCFTHEGKRYSHILNPITGWPGEGLRAVSVAANVCTVAGSIATIAMLKPQPEAIGWLADSGLPHVYMEADGEIDGIGLKPDQAATTTEEAVTVD